MLKVITPPAVEPVTLADVQAQTVVAPNADDALLLIAISAVRAHGEALTRRSWAPQTIEVVLDGFPYGKIELPNGPVTSITSVSYLAADGTETVLDTALYDIDIDSLVASVAPIYGTSWPETANKPNAVRVRYEAGWKDVDFPPALKQWMLVMIASFYAQRENHVVGFSVGQKVAAMPRGFCDALLDNFIVPGGI